MLRLWLDIGSAACISGSEPPAGSVPRAAAQGAKSDQAYTKQRQAGRLWHRGEGRGRNRDRAGRIAHVERGEACAVVDKAMVPGRVDIETDDLSGIVDPKWFGA